MKSTLHLSFIALLAYGITSCTTISAGAQELPTPAEQRDEEALSSYEEVTDFYRKLAKESDATEIKTIGQSRQDRDLFLLTMTNTDYTTPRQAHQSGKPIFFIGAQIHGDEPAGKEALMEFARDLAFGELNDMMDEVIFLFVPQMNPDGGELGEWGTRANTAGYNLNRDFPRLINPEAQAVADALLEWRPHVVVDAHELMGPPRVYDFYTWHPNNPNSPDQLYDYASEHLIPGIVDALAEEDYDHVIYHTPGGLFTEPEEGIFVPLYGRTLNDYAEALGSISILFESLRDQDARVDIEDRARRQYLAMRAMGEHISRHGDDVVATVREAQKEMQHYERSDSIAVEVDHAKTETISYRVAEMEEEEDVNPWQWDPTGEILELEVPVFADLEVTRARERPAAYLIKPHRKELAKELRRHDIKVERVQDATELEAEELEVTSREIGESPYEGYIPINVETQLNQVTQEFPEDSWLVRTNQSEAALIFKLMEPEDENSLVMTGALTTEVHEEATLPIYRLFDVSGVSTEVW